MNLRQEPTIEELKELIASCRDDEGHHILWVNLDGDVRIDIVPPDMAPGDWEDLHTDVQFRLETLCSGNGWVGPKAALNTEWIERLNKVLLTSWREGVRGYLDYF